MTRRAPFTLLLLSLLVYGCSGPADAPAVAALSVSLESASVEAGSVIEVSYRFTVPATGPPLTDDYVVFVHAVDAGGRRVWNDDHPPQPATREWTPGRVIEYLRPVLVPRTSAPGDVHLEMGLYSPSTGERLPLDAPAAGRRAYRVASMRVLPPTSVTMPAIFVDGWSGVERAADAAGTQWRWSAAEGHLWFRNPRHESALVLQLDGSVHGVDEPRRVEIRAGSMVVDRFELPQGRTEVRRIPVPAEALGDEDIARMVIAVDDAVVPARLAGAAGGDTRSLGVRVFDAYLEPR